MEYKILIEFIPEINLWNLLKLLPNYQSRKNFYLTQGKKFKFSLRVTNIDTSVFPGATISRIEIRSAASQSMNYPIEMQCKVSQLNPNASEDILIGNTVTLLEGLAWIDCLVSPIQSTDSIKTYQRELSTNNVIVYQANHWGQELFFIPRAQISAKRLNILVFLLTALTFWDATLGIRDTIIKLAKFIGKILISIGTSIS